MNLSLPHTPISNIDKMKIMNKNPSLGIPATKAFLQTELKMNLKFAL